MIMRKLLLAIVGLMIFAHGQPYRYGIGVIIGSPTGFSGKSILSERSAAQANLGWSFWPEVGFHGTFDYQVLFPGVIKNEEGAALNSVVPYAAIGGRVRIMSDEHDNTRFNVGLRLGGGIEYIIDRFSIFLEILPVVNMLPRTDFDFEGGLGFRFNF